MGESTLLKKLQLVGTKLGARLFRNTVGEFWVGRARYFSQSADVRVHPGSVLISNAARVHAGLCVGSSDLIGWRPLKIEPHHVGKTICQFIAVEGKTGSTRLTSEQTAFLKAVRDAGGIGVVAYFENDLSTALAGEHGATR